VGRWRKSLNFPANPLEILIIILIIGFVAYEFMEHVALPLFWFRVNRKKKAFCGSERLLGEIGEVKEWQQREGYVFVSGELWKAVSPVTLETGNKVVIQKAEGLTLTIDLLNLKENRNSL
jgi:membrane-bound serine protease (ClpP class)